MLTFMHYTRFFVFYPETCGKTLEEVELMFAKDGPSPWKTRKGESRLTAEIQAIVERKTYDEPKVAADDKAAEAPATKTVDV